jgi:hypothetical protein
MTLLILTGFFFSLTTTQAQQLKEASHYQSKPIVKMTLNGKKIWALLDTGTDITLLDANAKETYDFTTFIRPDAKFVIPGVGANNYYQLQQVRNAELHYGDTHLKRQVYAYNLSNVVSSIQERTGKKVTAIIGSDMMCAYGFVIDLGNKTVVLQQKDKRKNKMNTAATARGL